MAIYGVIGLGQLGAAVASYIAEHGGEVIAVDSNLARVEAIKERVPRALCLDATDERALRAAGLADCETVVLALGEAQLEEAVMTTMLLRDMGVGRIVSRAGSDVQGKVLERLGVSRVVFPERQIGTQIAREVLTPAALEVVPFREGISVASFEIPEEWSGSALQQLALRRRFGVTVVAVRRRADRVRDDGSVEGAAIVDAEPGPETVLQPHDVLMVIAKDEKLHAFLRSL